MSTGTTTHGFCAIVRRMAGLTLACLVLIASLPADSVATQHEDGAWDKVWAFFKPEYFYVGVLEQSFDLTINRKSDDANAFFSTNGPSDIGQFSIDASVLLKGFALFDSNFRASAAGGVTVLPFRIPNIYQEEVRGRYAWFYPLVFYRVKNFLFNNTSMDVGYGYGIGNLRLEGDHIQFRKYLSRRGPPTDIRTSTSLQNTSVNEMFFEVRSTTGILFSKGAVRKIVAHDGRYTYELLDSRFVAGVAFPY